MNQVFENRRTLSERLMHGDSSLNPFYLFTSYALGCVCFALDVYIIVAHRHPLTASTLLLIFVPIGLQVLIQLWRLIRYQRAISTMKGDGIAESAEAKFVREEAAKIGTSVLSELLSWSFIIDSLLLAYIAFGS